MAITVPPHIERITARPGKDWTPGEIVQVKEWLFEDAQLRYLLHVCALKLGAHATPQDAEDALSQFCTKRLDSVIVLYNPERATKKTFWNFILMCLERDCVRFSRQLKTHHERYIPLSSHRPDDDVGDDEESQPSGVSDPKQPQSPEGQAIASALRFAIETALESLSPNHRAAFLLLDVQEMNDKEAANILNAPAGTVRVWAARGRAALRQILTREGWNE